MDINREESITRSAGATLGGEDGPVAGASADKNHGLVAASGPDIGMLSAFAASQDVTQETQARARQGAFVLNPTIGMDEKIAQLRAAHFSVITWSALNSLRNASEGGRRFMIEGKLKALERIPPNGPTYKGLAIVFAGDENTKFPQPHRWNMELNFDPSGTVVEFYNERDRVLSSNDWHIDEPPSDIAHDIRTMVERLPALRQEELDERAPDLAINPRGPDNGPLEPWKVQDWVREQVARGDDLLSLDTETTGLNGSVLDVAVVNQKGEKVYQALVLPLEPIDPEATKVHGRTAESLQALGARPWVEVSPELREVLRDKPVVQYAENFFDKDAIERSDDLAGVKTAENVQWLDAMAPYQNGRGLHKQMKLIEASQVLGVELRKEDAHGAFADAKAAMGVFQKMADRSLDLKSGEVLLHKGEEGLEAFDQAGQRLEVKPEFLEKSLEVAKMSWDKPHRGLQSLDKGAYIRMELDPKITNWLKDGNETLTAVRAPLSASDDEIRERAIFQYSSMPLPVKDQTPYEFINRLRSAEIQRYADGN